MVSVAGGLVIAAVDGAAVVIVRLVVRESGTRHHQRGGTAGLLSAGNGAAVGSGGVRGERGAAHG